MQLSSTGYLGRMPRVLNTRIRILVYKHDDNAQLAQIATTHRNHLDPVKGYDGKEYILYHQEGQC